MLSVFCLAQNTDNVANDEGKNDKLNAGELIIGHLLDEYQWHFFTWKGHHVGIDLPVIVFDEGHLYGFSSKHLHHGEYVTTDKGDGEKAVFVIASDGQYKGKVVRMLADGTVRRPIDISITKNVFAIFISVTVIIILFLLTAKNYKMRGEKAPKGVAAVMEPIIEFVSNDIAKKSIGPKYEKYIPYLLTVFFFILINNLFGLIPFFPFGANITGNIAVTAVLATFTFLITNLTGTKEYYKDIFDTPGVPWWLKRPLILMPIIETVGCITKPFVLAIRLFANITAGHIVVLGFVTVIFVLAEMSAAAGGAMSVLSLVFSVFVDCLELLVAFVQAYVFTLLSAIYFGTAAKEEH